MEKRKNDLMFNVLANPTFQVEDFTAVDLNIGNTSLQDKSVYRNNSKVQQLFKKNDGSFDEKKFDQFYNKALSIYSQMSDKDRNNTWEAQFKFAANNSSVSADKRDYSPQFKIISVPNPTRQTYGLVGWNKEGTRKQSYDELAQSHAVLLNPKTAGDNLENAQWGKNPHDGLYNYFDDTLVMAQWDEDGIHIDPITGQETQHYKGEYKIGKDGTYYYEKLDGRDIYGKKVLNKMNILTEEGSALNSIDFLDSDDIDKSLGGTIMKNLALVGGMFIPYVGPYVTALSLIPQLAGIAGTMGKMAFGSNSPILSELEGFKKSWELQGNVSETAQDSVWNLENFINLVGDTMSQLKQQRFFFEKIPYLFTGKYAGSKSAINKLRDAEIDKVTKQLDSKLANIQNSITNNTPTTRQLLDMQDLALAKSTIANYAAAAPIDSFIKGYNKIGSILSKGYMTAITVADTYGEAKHAGASDLEATLLTLGYGAAEAALLNTGIGEWILPELHADKAFKKQALRKLVSDIHTEKPATSQSKKLLQALKGDKSDKRKYVSNVINSARDFFKGEFFTYGSRAGNLASQTLAGGLGEGIEEVSEEVLADVSKGLFNLTQWMTGDNTRLNSFGFQWGEDGRTWSARDIVDRYGMSFLGGIVGGGLTNLGTSYNYTKNASNMSSKEAYQYVVSEIRNGNKDDLLRYLDKIDLGLDKTFSVYRNPNGEVEVDPDKSQDVIVRNLIKQEFDFIDNVLQANKTNLTDSQLLDNQMLEEWRYSNLQNSQVANDYLYEFNKLNGDLINISREIKDIQEQINSKTQDSDNSQKPNDELETKLKNKQKQLKDIQQSLQDLAEGKRSLEFMSRALFEMTPYLNHSFGVMSKAQFAKQLYNKNYFDLTEDQQKNVDTKYREYKDNPTTRDNIRYGAQLYLDMAQKFGNGNLHNIISTENSPEYLKIANAIHTLIKQQMMGIEEDSDFIDIAQKYKDDYTRMISFLQLIDDGFIKPLQQNYKKNAEDLYNKLEKDLKESTKNRKDELDSHEKFYNSELDSKNKELDKKQKELENKTNDRDAKQEEVNKNPTDTKLASELKALQQEVDTLSHEVLQITNVDIPKLKDRYQSLIDDTNTRFNASDLSLKSDYKKTSDKNESDFQKEILDQLLNNVETYIQPLLDSSYIDASTKNEALSFLNTLENNVDNFYADRDPNSGRILDTNDEGLVYKDKILDLKGRIYSKSESKLDAILNNFSIQLRQNPLNYTDLVNQIYKQINGAKDISDIETIATTEDAINGAITTIDMLKAVINGASTDNISIIQGNPFGYNAILNEISQRAGTPVNLDIVSDMEALPLIHQLNQMKNELSYLQRIYRINQGDKLRQHDITNKQLVKAQIEATKRFIDKGDSNPLKQLDAANYAILESAIRSVTDKSEIETDQLELEKDKVKIKDAFYDFFNSDAVKDKLKDINNIIRIVDSFDLLSNERSPLVNQNINRVDDYSFIYDMLASAAMKTSSFYSMLNGLDYSKIAPLPTQVEALRIAYASMMNRDLFSKFAEAISLSIKQKAENMDTDTFIDAFKRLNELPQEVVDNYRNILEADENKKYRAALLNMSPRYDYINLIEGIAGSGKTRSIFNLAYQMLSKYHKSNLLRDKKIYFIHGSKGIGLSNIEADAKVQSLADELFGKNNVTGFSRKSFFENMVENYQAPTIENDVSKAPDGILSFDNSGNIITNQKIKDSVDIPSVIFIDEVTQFSDQDLLTLNNWAKQNGIQIIAAGDFDQNAIDQATKLKFSNGDMVLGLEPKRNYFINSMKLGLSMRTGNSVKTRNQLDFQRYLTDRDFDRTIDLKYFYDKDQLYGDIRASQLDDALEAIEKMVNTLENSEEKITYIYETTNSDLYQALQQKPYWDKLVKMQGASAQGDETRYSIVDIDSVDNIKGARFLYTGITRASQGSLIYARNITSSPLDSMYSEGDFEKNIKRYADARIDFLNKIYPNQTVVTYIPPIIQNNQQQNNQPPVPQNPPSPQNNQQNQNNQRNQNSQPQQNNNQPPASPVSSNLTEDQIRAKYGNGIDFRSFNVNINGQQVKVEIDMLPFTDKDGDTGNYPFIRYKNVPLALLNIGNFKMPAFYHGGKWNPLYKVDRNKLVRFEQTDISQNGSTLNQILEEFNNQTKPNLQMPDISTVPSIINVFESKSSSDAMKEIDTYLQNYLKQLSNQNLQYTTLEEEFRQYSGITDEKYYHPTQENLQENNYLEGLLNGNVLTSYNTLGELLEAWKNDDLYHNPISKTEGNFFVYMRNTGDLVIYAPDNMVSKLKQFADNNNFKNYEVKPYLDIVFDTQTEVPLDVISTTETDEAENSLVDDNILEDSDISNDVGKPTPQIINDNNIDFNIYYYSFNTLELGAVVNQDGTFDFDKLGIAKNKETRIDGVNGLRRLVDDEIILNDVIKPVIESRDAVECLKVITYIQNLILNTENKTDLCDKLKSYFEGFENSDAEIMVNFGIKQIPSLSSRARGKDYSKNTQFHKSAEEKCYGLDTTANNADDISTRQIVALIGDRRKGELLEIPLFTMSNPIAVLYARDANGQFIYKNAQNIFNSSKKTTDHEKYEEILQNPDVDQNLKNYIKIYLSNNYYVYRFNTLKWDGQRFIDTGPNSNWTPLKGLNLLGMSFKQERGQLQQNQDKFLYRAKDWIDLEEVVNDPLQRFFYSDIMQYPNQSYIENGIEYIQTGHSYILATQDKSILSSGNKNRALMEYYKKQCRGEVPKKVERVYIIPPEASLREYFQYIYNKRQLPGFNPNYRIGFIGDVYKIINALYNEKNIKGIELLMRSIPRFQDKRVSGQLRHVLDRLTKAYNDYYNEKDPLKRKDKLNIYKNIFKENYENGRKVSILTQLTNYLYDIVGTYTSNGLIYDDSNPKIAEIEEALKGSDIHIYYTPTISNTSESWEGAKPIAGIDSINRYRLNGKSFKIHGKLDSYMFYGNLPNLNIISDHSALNGEKPAINNKGYLRAPQNNVPQEDPIQTKINNFLGRNDYQVIGNTDEEKISNFIKSMNSNPNIDYLVYSINGELYKSKNNSGLLTNSIVEIIQNGQSVTSINIDTNGEAQFTLRINQNGETKDFPASRKSNEDIKVTTGTTSINIDPSIRKQNLQNIINTIDISQLHDLVKKYFYDNTNNKVIPRYMVYSMPSIPIMLLNANSDIRQQDIKNLLNNPSITSEEKSLLKTLESLEETVQKKQEECPIEIIL